MAGRHNKGFFAQLFSGRGTKNYSGRRRLPEARGSVRTPFMGTQGRARQQLLARQDNRAAFGVPLSPRAHERYPGRWGR